MRKERFYSLWFSALIIVIFLIQVLFPGFTDLFMLTPEAVPKIWQFVTAIFLHGSITHLLFNLFALFLFGLILERTIGSQRFLVVFFATGILANIISYPFTPNALGASGAIMGIIGTLAILRPMMSVWAFGMIIPMFIAAILWVGESLLGIFGFGNQGIGYIAHLSGVFSGILYGFYLRLQNKRARVSYEKKIDLPEETIHAWEETYMR